MYKKLIHSALAFLFLVVSGSVALASCLPDKLEMEWLDRTISVWKKVRTESLLLPNAKLPWLVLFDDKCVLNINPDTKFYRDGSESLSISLGGERVDVYSAEHHGKIVLPDSATLPPNLISFAATYDKGKRSFFAASLPSIWQKAPHLKDEKNLATLVRSVYIHELTHTYHRKFFSRLDAIEKGLKGVEVFDDDIVQNVFGKRPEFRDAFLSEIAITGEAVAAADITFKRNAARQIADLMDDRRRKFYTDQDRIYSETEDIFLTMEGVANWAAYKAAMVDGLSPGDASKLIRRGGKNWSQEQGILLFLLIDDLVPNWQKMAFGTKNVSITRLLKQPGR